MSIGILLLIIFGVPLLIIIVLAALLFSKLFSHDSRAERAETLEAARRLEHSLAALERRLTAIEDIILAQEPAPGKSEASRPAEDERSMP